ncbi:MAG: response regulator transcription factor [Bacteroidales bacterium]|nr:response regulator transcription factor [Bacteroidales bacterium]
MMYMLKALLVDDEIASIRSLQILLNQFCPQVEVIGIARSVDEALEQVVKLKPELIFLDIEMPNGTGFDFLERCTNCNFDIIFITAHNNYAIRAFKYSAIDYILKPIEIDELTKAVEKVYELKKNNFNSQNKYSALFDNLKEIIPQKLVVAANGEYVYVDLREVLFFEVSDEKVLIHLENGSKLRVDETINAMEESLIERDFYRVNHNILVNIQKVQKIIKTGNGSVILVDGTLLTLNPLKKDDLITRLIEKNIHYT